MQLKPLDKAHLVEIILESLDKPDPEIEKAWVAESEARYGAYKAGKIKAVSFDSIQKG
ncbi:MAG: addiction module protein [Candidatus Omnitrophica bacterium]|nr:addiction module protein [Candidatus Omnitrophota bacterium]